MPRGHPRWLSTRDSAEPGVQPATQELAQLGQVVRAAREGDHGPVGAVDVDPLDLDIAGRQVREAYGDQVARRGPAAVRHGLAQLGVMALVRVLDRALEMTPVEPVLR